MEVDNASTDGVKIILLLASYDPETKSILYRIRDEIAKYSTYFRDYIITLLLENVELFMADDRHVILVERFNDMATAMIFEEYSLIDVVDFKVNAEADVEAKLRSLNYQVLTKFSILDKLELLAQSSFLTFVIRHKELTRGGEYIELSFLLGRGLSPDKVYLFINQEIEISTMLKELIEATRIRLRTYNDESDLVETIRRVIYYEIKRNKM